MEPKFELCKPIASLVEHLTMNDFVVIEQKVSDYHFHELYLKLQANDVNSFESTEISIAGIEKTDDHKYTCSCHWSTVELVQG
jgi:hypothetical protein